MSIQVKLNGEPRELPDGATMAEAVAELTAATTGVAAAVNGDVVPRARGPSHSSATVTR